MATISFNDTAPKIDGTAHFVFGNEDFDLASGASYETNDPTIVSCALTHPWLKVVVPAVDVKAASNWDENDPHDNPAVDHLTAVASQETKDAADKAEAAIQAVAYPDGSPNANIPVAAQEASGKLAESEVTTPVPDQSVPPVTEPAPAAPTQTATAPGGSA